jgi:uncharacterized protein YaaN involved in tellurite resistance
MPDDIEPVTATATEPVLLTAAEEEEVRAQARQLVLAIKDATGTREMEMLDEISVVGLQAQRGAGRQLDLVRARMGAFLDAGGTSKQLANDLIDLRTTLDQINPDFAGHSFWGKVTNALPFLRNRTLMRALKKIAIRYEPVSKQVVKIETKLRDGRDLLERDNIELRQLYGEIEAQQANIRRQAYLSGVLLEELKAAVATIDDPMKRDRLISTQHDVAMRAQDLRTMLEVHAQYFVSIELTRQNNRRLGQAVDRTVALATNVVTVGLAIQMALIHQQQVKEATERTREFLGQIIVANAEAIRRHTDEIGDLYNNPVIAIDMVQQAHAELIGALDAASKLREEGIAIADENIRKLTAMTEETDRRLQALTDGTDDDR